MASLRTVNLYHLITQTLQILLVVNTSGLRLTHYNTDYAVPRNYYIFILWNTGTIQECLLIVPILFNDGGTCDYEPTCK